MKSQQRVEFLRFPNISKQHVMKILYKNKRSVRVKGQNHNVQEKILPKEFMKTFEIKIYKTVPYL